MPFFKLEHKVTIYVEAEAGTHPLDFVFGLCVDGEMMPIKDDIKIKFFSDSIGPPQEISAEEMQAIHDEHEKSMKCPSE
jgi:hypothetical protein